MLFVLTLVGSGLEALGLGLMVPLLEMLSGSENSRFPWLQAILRDYSAAGDPGGMRLLATALIVLFMVKNAILLYLNHLQGVFVWDNYPRLSTRILRAYLQADFSFLVRKNSAEFVNDIQATAKGLYAALVMPIIVIATEALVVLGMTVVLLFADPVTTVSLFAAFAALLVMYFLLIKRPMSEWGYKSIRYSEGMQLWLAQGLGASKEMKVLGREEYFIDRFRDNAVQASRYSRLRLTVSQAPQRLVETLVVVSVCGVLLVAQPSAEASRELIPLLGIYAMAAMRFMPSASRMAMQVGNFRYGIASVDKIHETVRAATAACTLPREPAKGLIGGIEREIVVEDVRYTYPGTTSPVLDGVSLGIRRGEVVAFVGSSGAGKTTLADVMIGLLRPDSGQVFADGISILDDLRGWQDRIGYIPQDVFLIDDILSRNVALGIPDEAVDADALAEAIAKAQLAPLVAALPDGLNTIVGERGARLSGGQRQRIGIARSLYHQSDLLVMDEATSALDPETEHAIANALHALRGDKTIIMIAHRLSTVKNCDRIYLLANGRVAAAGTFAELMRDSEEFRRMVSRLEMNARA